MTTPARIYVCMTITSILLWEMKNQNYKTSTPRVLVNFIKQWQHQQHAAKQVRLTVRDQGRTMHSQLHLSYQRNPHMNCPALRLSLCTLATSKHSLCPALAVLASQGAFLRTPLLEPSSPSLLDSENTRAIALLENCSGLSALPKRGQQSLKSPLEAPGTTCPPDPQPAGLLSEIPFPCVIREGCAFLTLTAFFNHLQFFSTPVAIRLVPNINTIKPTTMHHPSTFIHPEITATHTTGCWKLTSSCLTSPTLSNTHSLIPCSSLLTQLSPPSHRLPLGRGLPVSGRLRRRVAGTISGGR